MAETLSFLSQPLDNKNTSIKQLLKLVVFGDRTEKTAQVLQRTKAGGKKSGKKKKNARVMAKTGRPRTPALKNHGGT